MTFFYDLNKRLAKLATTQDAKQIAEDAKAVAPKSKLAESIEVAERATGDYSAKKARAGKDIGKPGKAFSKIAQSAGAKYGSKERGEKVAGAVLAKLRKEDVTDEGNAFTGKLKATPKGGKFKLGDKEFKDTSDLEEGFKEMDAWLAQREKEKGTGKFDVKDTGYSKRYTRKEEPEAADDEEKSAEPKRRGRPMGKPKGPERVTKGAWKHKGERKVKEEETDEGWRGGMLGEPNLVKTRKPAAGSNPQEQAYNELGAFLAGAKIRGLIDPHYIDQITKLVKQLKPTAGLEEKAVSKKQQKFMGMVHAAQKGEKPASKEVAKVAKEMPKKAAKDFAATKQKGLPEKVKAKKESKEDVEETTTSGSVATATTSGKSSKGGMQFGKGVYEGFNNSVEKMISESVDIAETISENEGGGKTITVTASGPEADMLMQLLKAAGLSGSNCGCGQTPCGCTALDENQPDWPTNTETSNDALQYAGGLNKPKSTGQTTTPVIASQLRRQVSMEESVELERSLFDTWKNYKG